MSQEPLLIQWTNIAKKYGIRTLFQDLSGEARSGQVLAVTGPNGSGKSTLLRILAGLLRPSRGTVTWPGDGELRQRIGYASPELRLYNELTGEENLSFFASFCGLSLSPPEIGARLERVGLASRDHRKYLGRYSSGMAQRVRLAFATLAEPPLLFLDEPGSNLDDAGRATVEAVIETQRKRGLTILATNDPKEAALADHHVHLG